MYSIYNKLGKKKILRLPTFRNQKQDKVHRREKIIKRRTEINKIESRKIQKCENKNWFFERSMKLTSSQANPSENKIKWEGKRKSPLPMMKQIIINTMNIKRIIRQYQKQLFVNTFDKLGEMNIFFERHKVLKFIQEEIYDRNHLHLLQKLISYLKKEKLSIKKMLGPDGLLEKLSNV